jgi:hypothetical protein
MPTGDNLERLLLEHAARTAAAAVAKTRPPARALIETDAPASTSTAMIWDDTAWDDPTATWED